MASASWLKAPLAARGAPRALGFLDGVGAFFGGLGFIVGRPAMWGWALIPIATATLLFAALGALFFWGGSELSTWLLTTGPTTGEGLRTAGLWIVRVVSWVVGLVLAFLLAISFAQPLSGFALDAIARRQDRALGGRLSPEPPMLASALRSLRVTLTALGLSVPVLALLALIPFVFPPAGVVTIPLKFLVTGLTVAYDFLDYPLGLRGVEVRERLAFVRTHLGAVIGFGASAGAVLLVPGLGLLLLPVGVAGATRLVRRADHGSAEGGPCEGP